MEKAEIGLIGLAVMGSNLALNIAEKGNRIAVFNRTPQVTDEFYANAGALKDKIIPCRTIEEFVDAIRPPRPIIIMIKAGDPVDQQMAALQPHLAKGDIMIDAGNANFRDTMARFARLKDTGLTFIGMGVSGGEEGARHGPSIMVGGTEESYKRVEKVLTSISAKYKDDPCVAWLGNDGAGHFVKTIHNGIEYADMQMIAEIYGILRDGLGKSAAEISGIFGDWNKGRLNSYLIEITEKVLAAKDAETGKADARHHPRQGRPEGHRQVVGHRKPADGHPGDGHRSGSRCPQPVVDEDAARSRREDLRHAELRLSDRLWPRSDQGPRTGAVRRQDRCLRAGLRSDGGSLERVQLVAADADDRQDLARRLHHPLAIPRRDHQRLHQGTGCGQPDRDAGLFRHGQGIRCRRCGASSRRR